MKDRNKLFTRLWDLPYGRTSPYHLYNACKNSKEFVQKLQLERKIPVHNGCVNSICWNDNGKYLLSGSDDQHLSVINGSDYSVLAYIQTGHRANIFSAKFLPDSGDNHVVSSSGDGIIIYSNLERPETSMNNKFGCHRGTAYEIMTVPNDPNTFLSCGEDKTVRWFDIRTKTSCLADDCKDDVLICCRAPVTSIAVNPLIPYQLAVGSADSSVQIFDCRMLSTHATAGCISNGFRALTTYFTVPEFTQNRRITSLCYSADGREMLVSYSSDYIYLFDVKDDLGKRRKILTSGKGPYPQNRPPMKRLRVRGDWSDTGPNSRPETESGENQESTTPNNLIRRMTDILSGMLFSSIRNRSFSAASRSSSESSPVATSQSHSEGDMDICSDSNNDEADKNATQKDAKNEASTSQASENNEASTSQASENNVTSATENIEASASENIGASASQVSENNETNTPQASEIKEASIPQTSENDENSDANLQTDNSPPNEVESVISYDCSAFEQKTSGAEPNDASSILGTSGAQSNDSSSIPGTSGVETKSENSTVIKDSPENSNLSEFNEPSSSSLNVSSEEQEQKISLPEKPSLDSTNTGNIASNSSTDELDSDESTNSNPPVTNLSSCTRTIKIAEPQEIGTSGSTNPVPERSSESETEAAVQSIQRAPNVPSISELQSPRSPSPELHENAHEVELMMEVDSWESDDSDDTNALINASLQNRRRGRDLLCDDDNEVDEKLVKKDKPPKNVKRPKVKKMYTGHRNARTMIKESTFWGDNFVMSGSDCGHIFIWDRHTTELVMIMEADHHVVNCLQPHPFDPILASSGIDYDIKLWAPLREQPFFDVEKANEIVKRNEIMLEVTKDTITVPASFVFNMFNTYSTLNQLRNGHRQLYRRRNHGAQSANPDSSNR